MFNYDYLNDFIKKLAICNLAPIQVELQPGSGCSGYNCKFCYGYLQELTNGEEFSQNDYYKLLDDIQGKVKFITLAGIKSEPLNNKNIYNIIKRIKENGFRLGIHTKGHLLNEHLSNLLNANTYYGDFMTFSIDASNNDLYNDLHGLPGNSKIFDKVLENIKYMYEKKKRTSSELNINVSYLLFKENASLDQLEMFVNLFGEICDRIRFSMPQLPNKTDIKPDYYLESSDDVRKSIEILLKKYPDKNIIFLDFDDPIHDTDFKYCYAQRFQAVVDHNGYVFPCPQITTKHFEQLTYGNLKNRSFWDIWNSDNTKRIFDMEVEKMDCRICDRKDEKLNIELKKLFDNDKVS